jgi:hypothetical protein
VESTTSETGIREGQCLGIGDFKRDVQSFGLGTCFSLFKQGRNVVGGCDVGEATRRRQRCVAISRSDVDDALSSAHINGLREGLANDLQSCADDGEIATRPSGLLLVLDAGKVGPCRLLPGGTASA